MIWRNISLGVVAALHMYFLILEMFLWTKPFGRKTFGMNVLEAEATKTLAANQGLYNGFLAAGLLWAILQSNLQFSSQIAIFFLSCVLVAAIYGAATVSLRILLIQGLPALIALLLTLFMM